MDFSFELSRYEKYNYKIKCVQNHIYNLKNGNIAQMKSKCLFLCCHYGHNFGNFFFNKGGKYGSAERRWLFPAWIVCEFVTKINNVA